MLYNIVNRLLKAIVDEPLGNVGLGVLQGKNSIPWVPGIGCVEDQSTHAAVERVLVGPRWPSPIVDIQHLRRSGKAFLVVVSPRACHEKKAKSTGPRRKPSQ